MNTVSQPRTARFNMRLRPGLHQQIFEIARGEGRSASNLIERILEATVAEHARRRNKAATAG